MNYRDSLQTHNPFRTCTFVGIHFVSQKLFICMENPLLPSLFSDLLTQCSLGSSELV